MADVTSGTVFLRGHVRGASENPVYRLTCLMGPKPPRIIDGYAKWREVERPKRKSLTEWAGVKPIKVELNLMIDYFTDGNPNPGLRCEEDMRTLELMAGASEKDKPVSHPPRIKWDANAQHDTRSASHLWWVIESLTWDNLMWNKQTHPNIVRAEATVVLMEWVEDEFITQSGSKKNRDRKKPKRPRGGGRKKPAVYVVTVNDLAKGLRGIAAKKLGNSSRWGEIARLQKPKIRDPMAIKAGQRLRMPRR